MAERVPKPRLIPNLVDEYARTSPEYVFARVPKTSNFADGFKDITINTFAKAVDEVAHRILSRLGRSSNFDTIAYIGPTDLRYYIIALAASKAGYKALLPSPRNSIEGLLSLLDSTSCRYLLSAPEAKVDHILAKHPMQHAVIKTFDDWVIQASSTPDVQLEGIGLTARDPFIVIHTSGSTGLPKPVTLYHGGLATVDAQRWMPLSDGYGAQVTSGQAESPERYFATLPPFPAAGILGALIVALYYKKTVLWPPTGRPISADLVDSLLDSTEVDACFLAPSVLEELSKSQASLERLGKLKYVQYAGGPLTQQAGDTVAKHTEVRNTLGSSEAAIFPIYNKEPEDWIYFHFNPQLKGIEFRDAGNGLYEQVFVRHPSTDPFHSTWYTFPDQQEYATKDLFSKHPSKPNLWLYEGRSDDVIVFSNGEKFNPKAMETTLLSHPDVNRVLVVGQAQFQPAALKELKSQAPSSDQMRKSVLDKIAPYVTNANEAAPGYAKLHPEYITFTDPEKPMITTDKGTVKRAATIRAYQQEIDQLYADAENITTSLPTIPLDIHDINALTKSLQQMMVSVIDLDILEPDQDIFSAGADSLQVINIVRQLKASLISKGDAFPTHLISAKIIYSNPTPARLAGSIHQLATQGQSVYQDLDEARIDKMKNMLAKFRSTGSLGSYLIDALLASEQVSKVICLNRAHDGGERKQRSVNASRGLITAWEDQVQFLKTDLSKAHLGLSVRDYDLLKESSYIIHNQWQVDFNLSLDSFEPHIAGVRNLIDLSNQSIEKPPILFTSTISTVENWPRKYGNEKVPEEAFHDFSIPSAMGYGEPKYVSELLLEEAFKTSSLSATICRVGQVAGPVVKGGMWNKQEWVPSIIASSKYLSKIPTTLPSQDTIPWIPVDTTANILVDLVLSDISFAPFPTPSPSPFFHHYNLVNPTPSSWASLIPTITQHLSPADAGSSIEPVTFSEWLEALQATAARTDEVKKNPAIKLLEFFGAMSEGAVEAELETRETVSKSACMRALKAVGPEWMEIWLKQWEF